jgi:hypothetical protein
LETRQLTLALESAIDRVETIYSKHDNPRVPRSGNNSSAVEGPALMIEPSEATARNTIHLSAFLTRKTGMPPRMARSWRWPGGAPLLRTAILVTFLFAMCMVLDRQFAVFGRFASAPVALAVQTPTPTQAVQGSGQILEPTSKPLSLSAGLPLPNVYGVYAVTGGHLYELQALAGRVPDQRVFMSTPIKTSSHTTLPNGRIAFIIYRREAANSAPERVTVRVVARVRRAMTFNKGQAKTTNIEDSWIIRNVSYDFRVAPVSENSEMLLMLPENPDFVFPAGRYGLVIKGQAYDFTVAGPITETAQCLEGVEASNGTFYSECRQSNERQL